ncbi:MAG: hypothetical protein Q7S58_16300 [Candidatus Binatus sp.]|uniref:hypothetical protein n=1 Tax=Candidatus Binatus sp. TaxID=2811406 RepID=UPI002728545D|nr:hypothetical protein [Candidatus Binatus sp.]MDO8433961.1 hypothetical protein [Candidatus Binatus sp.]
MNDKSLVCPQCGADAHRGLVADGDEVDWSARCANGHGEVTEDGLLLTTEKAADGYEVTQEAGKDGRVICRYGGPWKIADTLLQSILDLERQRLGPGKTVDLLSAKKIQWNLKAAKRRFRRLLNRSNNNLPPIEDQSLRELAAELLDEYRKGMWTGDDAWYSDDDLMRWSQEGFFQELKDYELRKSREPMLVLSKLLPEPLSTAFHQVRECYRNGLFVGTVGMSRVILEDVVKRASGDLEDGSSFVQMVYRLPESLLQTRDKQKAIRLKFDSNTVLHAAGVGFSESEAFLHFSGVAEIVSILANKGTLN